MKKNYQTETASRCDACCAGGGDRGDGRLAGAAAGGPAGPGGGAGLQVMTAMMDEDVTALCGPKGRHDPQRTAVRHGTEAGSVTLGGRRVPVRRPRVRARRRRGARCRCRPMSCSPRRSCWGAWRWSGCWPSCPPAATGSGLEPVGAAGRGEGGRSTSKSAVSRRFVAAHRDGAGRAAGRRPRALDLVALMVDGVHFAGHLCVVAFGIGIDGDQGPPRPGRGVHGERHRWSPICSSTCGTGAWT